MKQTVNVEECGFRVRKSQFFFQNFRCRM